MFLGTQSPYVMKGLNCFFFFFLHHQNNQLINLSKSMYVAIVTDDLVFSITTVVKGNDEGATLKN